jgi:hypothetical protein
MRMRRFASIGLALSLGLCSLLSSTGCASTLTTHVESKASLGRVVVYRNGIAYFERAAEVRGDTLELSVPGDKVDDFLKSLTVIDAETKKPVPISYPTTPPGSETGLVAMKIQLQEPGSEARPKKLLLTYVTEAPSWKPSYRVVLGDNGKVELEAWAIVDNTSGEDWRSVQLGVGSSSALSFRFDLHSVRTVQREMLAPTDLFAQAPPTGAPVYAGNYQAYGGSIGGTFDDSTIAEVERAQLLALVDEEAPAAPSQPAPRGKTKPTKTATLSGRGEFGGGGVGAGSSAPSPARAQTRAEQEVQSIARRANSEKKKIVVEGFAKKDDADRAGSALGRANRLREQLIANGVAPEQIEAVANTEVTTDKGGARVLEAAAPQAPADAKPVDPNTGLLEPIGVSHFESKSPMTVNRGTSAMVSILKSQTQGDVVYLYDAESTRGNDTFAFRAVRLSNPTDSTLETGPVTVFGQGRFIGEGLTDPIPGKSVSFIPFALDRQVVVEEALDTSDGIARIITAQRGVLSTEMRHTKKQKLTITNRLDAPASVYVRHTVPKGFKLSKHPEAVERIGDAYLFRVEVPAKGKVDVQIEEETPVFKTVDIRSPGGMELVRAFVSSAALEGDVAGKLKGLLQLQKDLGTIEERILTQREQMGEYRARMDELHAQLVTLKLVKTAGPLMKNLELKLAEVSDKISKATVDLVSLEEQRMISRIKLQDGVAELSLDKKEEVIASK